MSNTLNSANSSPREYMINGKAYNFIDHIFCVFLDVATGCGMWTTGCAALN